ncbi:dihydrofolate reductase [Devosia submarina]|uniref:dihydrofolate reductase n=1 Tax=Devosia submarina TaxID=1173082 RepID=UPI000D385F86|nr:dihydrofolate reductase [Devosia submarina]
MLQIIGHAIVSVDGKIAGADGLIPPRLRNDADWHHFQAALDRSDLVVLGRQAHDRFPNPGRRRLVVTRSVSPLADDPNDANSTLWNPAGISFPQAAKTLGLQNGTVAITGVFDLFVDLFTAFELAEQQILLLPTGLPCFSAGHPRLVLAQHGLLPQSWEILDSHAAVTLTHWQRP